MSEHKDESVNQYGWVIEGAWSHVTKPDYWQGSSAWGQDPDLALRFARKLDAERAASLMLDGVRVRISEHCWTLQKVMVCGVDCRPGDQYCNNYCNMAPQKGPMQPKPPAWPAS